MMDLNFNEFILLWGAYGISIMMACGLGIAYGYLKALGYIKKQDKTTKNKTFLKEEN